MKTKPDLNFGTLWNLSFGFFGVQIAYALQSANISRIFATLGSDPHNLSYFWILPPLMGILVQPIVGSASDRTWNKFGRRLPYLIIGAIVAVIVMCLLPNAGAFGLSIASAMIFGFIALMFLDTSINMAMQPFKMLVGDQVNERQKGLAYSIQSFLCNAGSLVGYLAPMAFTMIGIANIAPKGEVPDTVTYSFYLGAAILILCVIYTFSTVKEMPPKQYAEFHGIDEKDKKESSNMLSLLTNAPKSFWTVGIVQFFSWSAFMYMWTYTNGAVADIVWKTTDVSSAPYQEAGNWVGVLFAVQAVGSVIWAVMIPLFRNNKLAYSVSLILGGLGFMSILFYPQAERFLTELCTEHNITWIKSVHILFVSYFIVGFAWAAILAMPFTILTNSISGKNMGAYLGLFNGTICVPQIIAAACGGLVLSLLGSHQANMLILAGVFLIIGGLCVFFIKETSVAKK